MEPTQFCSYVNAQIESLKARNIIFLRQFSQRIPPFYLLFFTPTSTFQAFFPCIVPLYFFLVLIGSTRWLSLLKPSATSRGFNSLHGSCNFSMTSFRSHYGPGFDLASNGNEYQEYFLGLKAAGTWGRQQHHLRVPIV